MANNTRRKQGKKIHNKQEEKLTESLDELADFQEFTKKIPKELREALLNGATAKDIYEKFNHLAAARAVLIAMTEKDASKALAAIKDIQDRAHGKPTEKRETTHKFDELPDEELEAIVSSELETLEGAPQKDVKKH